MITNKNTQTISLKRSTALGIAALLLSVGVASAQLDRILKVGGAIAVADKFGGQINSALNKVTGQKNLEGSGITSKVVPVLSMGNRKAIGIVQVSGSKEAVDQTKAVAQIDTKLPLSGNARVLIPINTRSVVNPTRVPGVGVSAVIDIKF
ncbi:hypothetical protein EON83_23840 [bacterium]|nr:MAG: hypothetical protein EON83_23840 [bacterium]